MKDLGSFFFPEAQNKLFLSALAQSSAKSLVPTSQFPPMLS